MDKMQLQKNMDWIHVDETNGPLKRLDTVRGAREQFQIYLQPDQIEERQYIKSLAGGGQCLTQGSMLAIGPVVTS